MSTIRITIDHKANRKDVLALFTQTLHVEEKRGAKAGDAKLKKLGALRLLKAYDNWGVAQAHAREHKTANGTAPIYENREQWLRARKLAEAAIATALDRLI
jgi:molybdenum-dependent DNA-binding transcriptional regulator ModE